MLLRYGADKNLKTGNGETALDLAVSNDALGVIVILS
jgi:ankyrin repeat protein